MLIFKNRKASSQITNSRELENKNQYCGPGEITQGLRMLGALPADLTFIPRGRIVH